MKTTLQKTVHLCLVMLACGIAPARGQSPLDGCDPNANSLVQVVLVQPDGKILIGGSFTSIAPNGGSAVTRNHIARLNPDGSLDTAFNPNANAVVYSLVLQADGKILAGGDFTTVGGQARNRIARLDPTTGAPDSFNPNANSTVRSIATQTDGKILVGGNFTTVGGQTRNRIVRLDPTTGLADSFDPNASNLVLTVVLQSDGKILVGGLFNSIGGQTRNDIARLDPNTGLADSFNPNANSAIFAIATQADGKILAGGGFTTIGGQTRNHIARLDPATGSADSFNPNANDFVYAITVQPDGQILVGGGLNLSSIGGQPRNSIARLNPISGLADSFDPNSNDDIYSIAVQSDGRILIGGAFVTLTPNGGVAPVTRNRIARLERDGRVDQTLNNLNLDGKVHAIAVQADGKILIGGEFLNIIGVGQPYLARLNTDGTPDFSFQPYPNDVVWSIAVQPDGKILVGGDFTHIGGGGGVLRNRIARLGAPTGLADSFDPNADEKVFAIAIQVDGKVLVGGSFNNIGGSVRNFIARLDPTSGLPDSFNPNANDDVTTIALQADGKILTGGNFSGPNSIGGQTRNYIARLDPNTGLADSFDPNANSLVYTLVVQPDAKILVGGYFNGTNSIGGQTRNHIARLDPITGLADSFDPNAADNAVWAIAVQANGSVLVGGPFTTIGGQTRARIARLDPATGLADSFNPGSNAAIAGIAVQGDGKILVAGHFATIGGQSRNEFARLKNDVIATQDLIVSQNVISWTPSGSNPQFSRVSFFYSFDSTNFIPLGEGAASGSSWTLTGLNLPTGSSFFIRARGHARTGYLNGSESIMDSVRNVFLIATPTPTPTPTATPTPTLPPTPTSTPSPSPTPAPTPTATPTPPESPTPTPSPSATCSNDIWAATNTASAAVARDGHTAVWTGTEMIVWGGSDSMGLLNTGGRYTPGADSWTATTTTNAPIDRQYHTAVWTGTEMIIWGGYNNITGDQNTGARYNPANNTWTTMSTVNAPTGHKFPKAIWTGTEMIVWGGRNGGVELNTGGRYNPATDTWIPITTTNAPIARGDHTAIWTGSEMIVWGGFKTGVGALNTGGRYNSATDTWTPTNSAMIPLGRYNHTAVWTGSEMVVWGGSDVGTNQGWRYNPATDTWASTSTTNAPSVRYSHTAIWTGSEMIVWGGISGATWLGDGGRYNPATDSWAVIGNINAPAARAAHTSVWSSNQMIVWGGSDSGNFKLNTGGKYCAQPPPVTFNISGAISYCSNPTLNPVPGVTMTLTGTSSSSTTTNGSGVYSFAGLMSGGSYTVTPAKATLPPGSAGISTVDVIAIQRQALNLGTPLSGCRLTAADVNGINGVDTVDVIAAQRFALGLSTGIGNAGKYQFTPASRSYSGIVSDQTGQNYDTLVFGDVASPFAH